MGAAGTAGNLPLEAGLTGLAGLLTTGNEPLPLTEGWAGNEPLPPFAG